MLAGNQYWKAVRRPYKPFLTSLIFIGSSTDANFIPLWDQPACYANVVVSDSNWFWGQAESDNGATWGFEALMKPEKLDLIKRTFKAGEERLMAAAKGSDFTEYCDAYEAYIVALIIVWLPDPLVAKRMRELLEAKLSPQEAEELMSEINVPLEDNFYKQEEYDLVMTDDLEVHAQKYAWLNARYGEELYYTAEMAAARKSTIDKAAFTEKWNGEKEKVKKAVARAKELLGNNAHLVDVMQYIVYYRTQRTDIMNCSTFCFMEGLKKKAAAMNLTYVQLLHATRAEIEGELPSTEELDARIVDHATVMEDRHIYAVSGSKAAELREFLREDTENLETLKGSIACKGNVTGKVKVIKSRDDFAKIEAGDILVASMTSPNMVPIMRLAAAFVTDEGGITCHAAIISREMNKPCIIGTRVATQALKDGDLVEVDANAGIVRLVKN